MIRLDEHQVELLTRAVKQMEDEGIEWSELRLEADQRLIRQGQIYLTFVEGLAVKRQFIMDTLKLFERDNYSTDWKVAVDLEIETTTKGEA